jgi:hypothetical protein
MNKDVDNTTDADTRWPDAPTPADADLRVATLDLPYPEVAPLRAGVEAIGRFVKVRVTGPADAQFALRHPWISTDIGLPGAYIPLDGAIRIAAGRAKIAVCTDRALTAFMALVAGALVLGSITAAVQDPGWWSAGIALLVCAMAAWCYRRAERAKAKVVADALEALGTVEAGPLARSTD